MMSSGRWGSCWDLLAVLILFHAGTAVAGIHTWDVNEVFSNSDGTIQFVELWEAGGGANETGVGTGTLSSNTQSFAIGAGSVDPPTGNKFFLIGTAAFCALAGAPPCDAMIPPGSIVFFNTAGDTVAFGGFDSWVFGAVPTNGTLSLDRVTGTGANTPTNYAGTTGFVDVSTPLSGSVPAASKSALGFAALLLVAAGAFIVRQGRGSIA